MLSYYIMKIFMILFLFLSEQACFSETPLKFRINKVA